MSQGGGAPARPGYRLRAYHLLAAVPGLGMLGGVPYANRVHTLVLGMPFLLLWIVLWVLATSACMVLLYVLDRRHQPDPAPDESAPR